MKKAQVDGKIFHVHGSEALILGWDREGGREMQEGRDMGTYVYV